MTKQIWVIISFLVFLFIGPHIANTILGGSGPRCVGVDNTGEVVKAIGNRCNELEQVVYTELGPDGQIQYFGTETVELGP